MIAEALEYLFKKTEAKVHQVGSLPYTDKGLTLVEPPLSPSVHVQTLGSMVSLVQAGVDALKKEETFIQVVNHFKVLLLSLKSDEFGRRREFVAATISELGGYPFGRFMEPEAFVISLNSLFVENSALKSILALTSSLTAESVNVSEDDGISQTATTRQGIALKSTKKIDPKVDLCPYRTFREVEQPSSTFLFRLRGREGQAPECALFEADGGAWKLEAVKNISEFLKDELPKMRIVY